MKQIKLRVPDNWGDITIRQYQQFMDIMESKKREKTKTLEMVSLFCNVDKKVLKDMSFGDLQKVSNILIQMTKEDPSEIKIVKHIKFKDEKFAIIPNMSEMTTGEFIDLETYCEDSTKNLHKIMSILYRKQIGDVNMFGRYEVESYDPSEEKKEAMKDLPMNYALGVLNFFFSLGEILLEDLNNSLNPQT